MKLLLFILILPWHLLTWYDFNGSVPVGTPFDASSNTALSWTYSCDDTIIYEVHCTAQFDTDKSFTQTKSPETLKHEQGHFNIAEIFARKSNALTRFGMLFSVYDFEILSNKIEKDWKETDDRYDCETNHSLNREAQERWNKWIAEQLKHPS